MSASWLLFSTVCIGAARSYNGARGGHVTHFGLTTSDKLLLNANAKEALDSGDIFLDSPNRNDGTLPDSIRAGPLAITSEMNESVRDGSLMQPLTVETRALPEIVGKYNQSLQAESTKHESPCVASTDDEVLRSPSTKDDSPCIASTNEHSHHSACTKNESLRSDDNLTDHLPDLPGDLTDPIPRAIFLEQQWAPRKLPMAPQVTGLVFQGWNTIYEGMWGRGGFCGQYETNSRNATREGFGEFVMEGGERKEDYFETFAGTEARVLVFSHEQFPPLPGLGMTQRDVRNETQHRYRGHWRIVLVSNSVSKAALRRLKKIEKMLGWVVMKYTLRVPSAASQQKLLKIKAESGIHKELPDAEFDCLVGNEKIISDDAEKRMALEEWVFGNVKAKTDNATGDLSYEGYRLTWKDWVQAKDPFKDESTFFDDLGNQYAKRQRAIMEWKRDHLPIVPYERV